MTDHRYPSRRTKTQDLRIGASEIAVLNRNHSRLAAPSWNGLTGSISFPRKPQSSCFDILEIASAISYHRWPNKLHQADHDSLFRSCRGARCAHVARTDNGQIARRDLVAPLQAEPA